MKTALIIPAHNEANHLRQMLNSVCAQTRIPNEIIVVDDNSTDNTYEIANQFSKQYSFIQVIKHHSTAVHEPGSKVVKAFYAGFNQLKKEYDLIGKFDADLILPPDYFEKITNLFINNPKIGMASGLLYIKKGGAWEFEAISEKDKVRGPIKLYRKACFNQIGGLKKAIGWDTADELLARYHGWEIATDKTVHVKHLKPTGASYTKKSRFKQGEAFYRMRYGFLLTGIAAAKLAFRKKSSIFLFDTLKGYCRAKKEQKEFLVSEEEGKFIRDYRKKGILTKLFFKKQTDL